MYAGNKVFMSFQVRINQFKVLLRAKKLSQYYWIDQWAKVERARMRWAAANQKQLKVEHDCAISSHCLKSYQLMILTMITSLI